MQQYASEAPKRRVAPLAAEPGLFDPTEGVGLLRAAEEGTHVWGVDCSTLRVSVGIDGNPPHCATKSFTRVKAHEPARLAMIWHETRDFALQLALEFPPGRVFVEQPSGQHPNPPLMYATGVIQAALVDALDVPLELIAVASWKKAAVGHGFAKKAQTLAWAQRRGYTGNIEDESDALGIAVGGAILAAAA